MGKKKDGPPDWRDGLFDANDRAEEQKGYRVYSTGSFMLDAAIGEKDPIYFNGGITERTVAELFGSNQTLKSALTEQLAKSVLLDNKENYVLSVCAEEPDLDRLDSIGFSSEMKSRMMMLGCFETDDVHSGVAERHLETVKLAIQDPAVKLVIIDSIKALCFNNQIFGKKGEIKEWEQQEQMAIRATKIGEFIRDFKMLNKRAILLMTNQTSDKIGPDYTVGADYRFKTPGGRAMEFECHLRIQSEARPVLTEKEHKLSGKKVLLGWEVMYRLIKNKFSKSSGNRIATSKFYFDPPGFRKAEEILYGAEFLTSVGVPMKDFAVTRGGGGNWNIAGNKLRGEPAAVEFFNSKPDLVNQMEKYIMTEKHDGKYISEYLFKMGPDEGSVDDLA